MSSLGRMLCLCWRPPPWLAPYRYISSSSISSRVATTCSTVRKDGSSVEQRWELEAPGAARLDALVAAALAISRTRSHAMIRNGQVVVSSGERNAQAQVEIKPGRKLRGGERVSIAGPVPESLGAPESAAPEKETAQLLDIVYEDEYLLVVNKPAGLVVHPAPGHRTGTLVHGLLYHLGLAEVRVNPDTGAARAELLPSQPQSPVLSNCEADAVAQERSQIEADFVDADEDEDFLSGEDSQLSESSGRGDGGPLATARHDGIRPGIVHRLDKGTSGLIVVAKDITTHESLQRQFQDRSTHRTYFSVVKNWPKNSSGRVVAALARDTSNRRRMAAIPSTSENQDKFSLSRSRNGKWAASKYVVERYMSVHIKSGTTTTVAGKAAVVKWNLETGRTHQIRAHARLLGHPLFGDDLYGGAVDKSLVNAGAAFSRPALHAAELGFTHPVTNERIHLEAALPEDLQKLLNAFT